VGSMAWDLFQDMVSRGVRTPHNVYKIVMEVCNKMVRVDASQLTYDLFLIGH
jgi:Zn-dependent M32 family carboxypeptidase